MYRIAFILLAAAAVALGLIVGTLNSEPVVVDLLWIQLEWPLGLVMLLSTVFGLVIGSALVWLTSVLPARLKLNRLNQHPGASASGSPDRNHG